MNILNLLILFLGISTPSSLVVVAIHSSIFGLLLKAIFVKKTGKRNNVLLIVFALLYGLVVYLGVKDINFFGTALICIFLNFLIGQQLLKNSKKFILTVLVLMILGYGLVQLIEGESLRRLFSVEPVAYNSDMSTYLKVLISMKKGEDFYESLSNVSKQQFGEQGYLEIWAWKQPLIFYLWKIFPGDGRSIIYLGLIIFSANLMAVYLIGRKFLSAISALLCPYIIWPYFRFPLVEQTIAQVEWWALSALIMGFMLLLYNKRWLAGFLFAICLGIRELFVIPIAFIVMVDLIKKDLKQTIKLVLPTVLLLLPFYLFVHIQNISKYADIHRLINYATRSGMPSGWKYIRPTLAYNSWSYALSNFRPFLVLLILNSFFLLLKIKRDKKYFDSLILAAYLPFFFLSLKIGMFDLWHDYWGIYFVPFMLLATPISLNYFIEKRKLKLKNENSYT